MNRIPPSEGRFLGVLSVAAALTANPWFLTYVLSPDGRIDSLPVRSAVWSFPAVWLLLGLLLLGGKLHPPCPAVNVLLVLQSVIVSAGLLVAVDVAFGLLVHRAAPGLVFPPNSHQRYLTDEFDCRADINSLGFRDREYPVAGRGRVRILALGDSFTFGWGVSLDETWCKILEGDLRRSRPEVEILNLGRPGATTTDYARIATAAIPLLRPDLVLVCVLQGDDLWSLLDTPAAGTPGQAGPTLAGYLRQTADLLLRRSNLVGYMKARGVLRLAYSVEAAWSDQAAELVSSLDQDQRARFERMAPDARASFLAGRLNPHLVANALRHPGALIQAADLAHPLVAGAIATMADDLAAIGRAAAGVGARAVVVSVPYGYYLCPSETARFVELGFDPLPMPSAGDPMDQAIARAAATAGLPFLSVTSQFREACDAGAVLFFPRDRHFNRDGNRAFARALLPSMDSSLPPPGGEVHGR